MFIVRATQLYGNTYIYSLQQTGWRVDSDLRKGALEYESFSSYVEYLMLLLLSFLLSSSFLMFDLFELTKHTPNKQKRTQSSRRKLPSHFKCEIFGLSHQNNISFLLLYSQCCFKNYDTQKCRQKILKIIYRNFHYSY